MSAKRPRFKCLDCNEVFRTPEDLYAHIEDEHSDLIPPTFTAQRYNYMRRTGKRSGSCVMCRKETSWNESTNKYNRFCNNPACKNKYREEFKKRMVGKYGKVHLLNDPEKQREMLAKRSISGNYRWSDGSLKTYTGSYEKRALEFEDVVLGMKSSDVMTPSPHNYVYKYEGKDHFYFPDQYLVNLNADIEIKDGGDNPNKHPKIIAVDKVKEKLKDDVMLTQNGVNYLKLTNNNMELLLKFIETIKNISMSDNPNRRVIMIEKDITIVESKSKIISESYEPTYELTRGDKVLLECLYNDIMNNGNGKEIISHVEKDLLQDMLNDYIREEGSK